MSCTWSKGLCLVVLSCWIAAASAVAATESGPASPKKQLPSSAELLYNEKATPEEDYEAGMRAFERGELVEAQGIFERAARRGHSGAMAELAKMLEKSGFYAEAADWFRKSAELGDPEGQYGMGTMMLDYNSYNLEKLSGEVDYVAARKWFEQAAEQGHPAAITAVYAAYVASGLGVTDAERTDEAILKWTRVAADAGLGDAMLALSRYYRKGLHGLAVDEKLANEWEARSTATRGLPAEEKKVKKKQRLK